jgi:hypothetical protein
MQSGRFRRIPVVSPWSPRTAGIGRNLAVHQGVDEGRVAALLRTSIIAACTTYALASCLRASEPARQPGQRAIRQPHRHDDRRARA